MNIAFVNSTAIWSGVKTWMVEFGQELQKRGHHVYHFGRDPLYVEEVRQRGGTAFQLKFGCDYNPVKIRYFYRKFRQLKVDMTCMNIQKELRTAGIAAKMLNIPVVHRVGLPGDINRKPDQRLAQHVIVDEILVTSGWIKEELVRRFEFTPAEKICLIHNAKPVNTNHNKDLKRPVMFAVTSRLAEGKGHLTIIEAFRQLLEDGCDDFCCEIFGNGPRESAINQAIVRAGLEDKVRLRGFRNNIREHLKRFGFGILASREEGFPNTVAEYLSNSLPCIATDGGGTGELIRHERNGFLFSYQDTAQLVNLLKRCLTMSDENYGKLSLAARATMQASYELNSTVQILESYFERLVREQHLKQKWNLPLFSNR